MALRRSTVALFAFEAAVLGLAAVTLWAQSIPWNDWEILIFAAPLWLLAGVIWLAGFWVILRRPPRPNDVVVKWLVPPAIVLLTLGAWWLELPLGARFAASRADFDGIAIGVSPPRDAAGLYEVREFRRTAFGVEFEVSCSGLLWCSGFAYSPEGPPGPVATPLVEENRAYRHLDGPWYIWALRST